MDIAQVLRNAINNKVTKILKEEYGIETPKEIADKLSKMEQKKYELTKETMCFDDVTFHRIQAIKDFGDVTAGEHGGCVESILADEQKEQMK